MDMQGFLNSDGSMTEDGRKMIEWMESQFLEADQKNDVAFLSSGISGDIQYYYINVYKTKMMSPEQWLRDYRQGMAQRTWSNYQWSLLKAQEAEQQASQMEAQAQKSAELEAGMNSLKEALATQKESYEKDMEALRAEIERLMAGGKKRASKKTVIDDEDDDAEV